MSRNSEIFHKIIDHTGYDFLHLEKLQRAEASKDQLVGGLTRRFAETFMPREDLGFSIVEDPAILVPVPVFFFFILIASVMLALNMPLLVLKGVSIGPEGFRLLERKC